MAESSVNERVAKILSRDGTMAQEAENIFNVADQLRDARKRQKLSVDAVAKEICVRTCYLNAIEDSRFDDLPGKTFANGFVKSYAKMVKLDQDKLSKQFKSEFAEYFNEQRTTGSESAGADYSGHTSRAAGQSISHENIQMLAPKKRRWPAWFSPVIGLVGAGMSWFLVGANSSITSIAAIDSVVEERTLAEFADPVMVQQVTTAIDQQTSDPVLVDADGADALAAADLKPSSASFAATSIFLPAAHAANHVPSGEVSNAITFQAVEDSWVQLAYRDGTELWSGILRAGQSYRPQLVGEVFLTTSNAGGIILKQSDATLGPLGERGRVIKAMALDASIFESESFSDAARSAAQYGGSD